MNYDLKYEYSAREEGYVVVGITHATRNLVDVKVPSSYRGTPVVGIGFGAFDCDEFIRSASLPSTIRMIAANAFAYCLNLERVALPRYLEELSVGVFLRCARVSSLILPNSLRTIRQLALFGSGVRSLAIPASTTAIFPQAIPQGAVLHGSTGSFAETFARRNGFRFRTLR